MAAVSKPTAAVLITVAKIFNSKRIVPTYIEFVDTGFTSTRQYYRAKKPIFKKYASDCKEIQLDFNTLNNKAEELELIRENVKAQYEAKRMFIDYRDTFDINSVYKKDKDK